VFTLDLGAAIAKAPAVDGVTYIKAVVTDPGKVEAGVDQAANCGTPLRR
jgi:hypothetical protein